MEIHRTSYQWIFFSTTKGSEHLGQRSSFKGVGNLIKFLFWKALPAFLCIFSELMQIPKFLWTLWAKNHHNQMKKKIILVKYNGHFLWSLQKWVKNTKNYGFGFWVFFKCYFLLFPCWHTVFLLINLYSLAQMLEDFLVLSLPSWWKSPVLI